MDSKRMITNLQMVKNKKSSFKYVLRTGTLSLRLCKAALKLASNFRGVPRKSAIAPGHPKPLNAWIIKNKKVMIPAFTGITTLLDVIDARPKGQKRQHIKFIATYRGNQASSVKELLQVLRGEGGVFLNAPPGSGKTVMTLAVIARLKCYPAVVLVDQDNIGQQWVERAAEFMPEAKAKFGKLKDMDLSKIDIAITTLQGLARDSSVYKVGILIADEAHTIPAKSFLRNIYDFKFRYSMAVTASDTRADRLEWIFKSLLGTTTVTTIANRVRADIIQKYATTGIGKNWQILYQYVGCGYYKKNDTGFLVTMKHCMCECENAHTECEGRVKLKQTMYNTSAMYTALGEDEIWQDFAINEIKYLVKEGRQLIVFFTKNDTINDFAEKLRNLGIDARAYVGKTKTKKEKANHKKALKAQVTVTNYKKAGKGLDEPHKDAIVAVVPASKAQLNQFIGRIERWLKGKSTPVFIDLVSKDNMLYFMSAPGREQRFAEMGYEVTKIWV